MLMAQSDVFYELFKHSSGKITILTLKNAVSSNTMEKFIEWIYLGTVKGVPGTNLEEFYKLAAEYQILALKVGSLLVGGFTCFAFIFRITASPG